MKSSIYFYATEKLLGKLEKNGDEQQIYSDFWIIWHLLCTVATIQLLCNSWQEPNRVNKTHNTHLNLIKSTNYASHSDDLTETFCYFVVTFIKMVLCEVDLRLFSWLGKKITCSSHKFLLFFLRKLFDFHLLKFIIAILIGFDNLQRLNTNSQRNNRFLNDFNRKFTKWTTFDNDTPTDCVFDWNYVDVVKRSKNMKENKKKRLYFDKWHRVG